MRLRWAIALFLAFFLAAIVCRIVQALPRDHTPSGDFTFNSANAVPRGLTWDGTYYRVLDSGNGGDNRVYAYDSSGSAGSSVLGDSRARWRQRPTFVRNSVQPGAAPALNL